MNDRVNDRKDEVTSADLAAIQADTLATYEILIRESHLDSFGHVNNAMYLTILEEARWDIITHRGYGLSEVHKSKIGPVILEVNLKFQHELQNRERVTIKSGVLKHSGKISVLRQVMFNSKGQQAAVADFVIGLFDLRARKLIDYTPEWKRALGLT